MALNIDNLWVLNIAGREVWITETVVNTWFIMLVLIVLAIIARIKLRTFQVIPSGFQNIVEAVVETFDNFVTNTLGKKLSYIAPWFFMVFIFILSSSFFSTFGLRAPTADWATTFAFAFASFSLMLIMGFWHRRGEYLKSFFSPHFVYFLVQ